jgi:3-hexulose-6-phosphate synthase/6-phospho-3-hexuloisomerase
MSSLKNAIHAKRFEKISSTTLSDVFDEMNIESSIIGLKPVIQGVGIIGKAVTVKAITGIKGTYHQKDFKKIFKLFEIVKKGDVIVFDNMGVSVSGWGGLASTAMKNLYVNGLIMDGGVRDVNEIRESGFQVFTRFYTPKSAQTRMKIDSINEPIQCCGIQVSPGDIIIGDSTSIAVVPILIAEEILKKALIINEKEKMIKDELVRGSSFIEATTKYSRI